MNCIRFQYEEKYKPKYIQLIKTIAASVFGILYKTIISDYIWIKRQTNYIRIKWIFNVKMNKCIYEKGYNKNKNQCMSLADILNFH